MPDYSSNENQKNKDQSNVNVPPKPVPLPVSADSIPGILKQEPRWVCWRYGLETNKKGKSKWTKVPYCPFNDFRASSTKSKTWASFSYALQRFQMKMKQYDGIGFMLGDGWAGIDIDACRQGDEWTKPAQDIVQAMNTYTEVSPSGTGVKMLCKASIGKGRKTGDKKDEKDDNGFKAVEIYSQGRFFTVTGQHLPGTPTQPQERQDQAEAFIDKYFPEEQPETIVDHSDYEPEPLTEERFKAAYERAITRPYGIRFQELWKNNWEQLQDYSSQSEADFALVNYLAYELGPDLDAIDCMFRESGLMRDKWNETRGSETYGSETIKKVVATLMKWHGQDAKQKVVIEELEPGLPTTPTTKPWDAVELWNYKSKCKVLIPNTLNSGTHTVLTAREKRGKTYWMFNTITDWLSLGIVAGQCVNPLPVLYLDFEMGVDLFQKFYFARLFPEIGSPTFSNASKHFFYYSRDDGRLPIYLSVKWLEQEVKAYKPGLIIIDTIRGAFSADPQVSKEQNWENSASSVGNVLRPMSEFCHKTGWNIISIHHNNKNDNFSGSTEFGASPDAIWSFQCPEGEEKPGRLLRGTGRGVSCCHRFKFEDGRYEYVPATDNGLEAIRKWIIGLHSDGLPLTQAEVLNQRPEHFADNKVRECHKKLRDDNVLIRNSKTGGFVLAS